jgi:hypothetical protein
VIAAPTFPIYDTHELVSVGSPYFSCPYGAVYQVRSNIPAGTILTINFANSILPIYWIGVKLKQIDNLSFSGSVTSSPWGDNPFGGSLGFSQHVTTSEFFVSRTAVFFPNPWSGLYGFMFLEDSAITDFVEWDHPMLQNEDVIFNPYNPPFDSRDDDISPYVVGNTPPSRTGHYSSVYNYFSSPVTDDLQIFNSNFDTTCIAGITTIRTAGTPTIHPGIVGRGRSVNENFVKVEVTQDITAPSGLVIQTCMLNTVRLDPSADITKYPSSVTDNAGGSPSNVLRGRAMESFSVQISEMLV